MRFTHRDPPTDVFSSSGADLSFKFDPNKSRRDVAGFTCTWPACGRWFRHQTSFNEHQRMHNSGIPSKFKVKIQS